MEKNAQISTQEFSISKNSRSKILKRPKNERILDSSTEKTIRKNHFKFHFWNRNFRRKKERKFLTI